MAGWWDLIDIPSGIEVEDLKRDSRRMMAAAATDQKLSALLPMQG